MRLLTILAIIIPTVSALGSWSISRPDPTSPLRIYTYNGTEGKIVVEVDDSKATFSIDVPEKLTDTAYGEKAGVEKTETALFSNYVDAAANPTNKGVSLPSLELCCQKGKFFDDGMYGGLEMALELGGTYLEKGKQEWCRVLAVKTMERLSNAPDDQKALWEEAAVFATAAYLLGLPDVSEPELTTKSAVIMEKARKKASEFRSNPLFAKPIGFYTLRPELGLVFTRDRFLQHKFGNQDNDDAEVGLVLCQVILSEPQLASGGEMLAKFYSRLTNPLSCLAPKDLAGLGITPDKALADSNLLTSAKKALLKNDGLAILPPSRSVETDLANMMGGLDAVGGNTMQLLIDAVKQGKVSLAPNASSGWYSYQQYALEYLLKLNGEEAGKLKLSESYRKRLEEAFRSMLTQARETHVKQLDMVKATGAAPHMIELKLDIFPDWLTEPLPTYYQRVADGYTFVNEMLLSSLGSEYKSIAWMNVDGTLTGKISEELANTRNLFIGFNAIAARGLGIAPVTSANQDHPAINYQSSALAAEKWLEHWQEDPLMKRDIRVMVPMGVNSKGQLTCWCVLGIQPLTIDVKYETPPEIRVKEGKVVLDTSVNGLTYTILTPVFTEVVLDSGTPLTRDEFRALCDRGKTKDGILAELGKIHSPKPQKVPEK